MNVRVPTAWYLRGNRSDSNYSVGVNNTMVGFQESKEIRIAYDVIINSILVLIILGMGCGITLDQFKLHLRRPTGMAIGLLSQTVVLPFVSFALAHSLGLETVAAVGMMVMAVTPCGMMSSVFSYWVDGDVSLSFTISILSTLLAFGTIPLNLLIYSGSWTDRHFVIPFSSILVLVGITTVPLLIGIVIRWRLPKVASVILKIGSYAGVLLVALSLVMLSVLYPFMYWASWKIYIAAISYPYISFMFGYVVSTLFKMENFRRRTIALETGMQNYTLCFAILEASLSPVSFDVMSVFPLLYGVNVLTAGFVFVGIYKFTEKYGPKPVLTEEAHHVKHANNHGESFRLEDQQTSKRFLDPEAAEEKGES